MRLAIRKKIPFYRIASDYVDAVKDQMLREMGCELLDRYQHLVRQSTNSLDDSIDLHFEIDVLAKGELEAITGRWQAQLERAVREAKPRVVDDFGNEVGA